MLTELEIEQLPDKIQTGEGLIAYRKYLWALKFLTEKLERTQTYRNQVVADIDSNIQKQEANIQRLRDTIQQAMEADGSIPNSKTGGKTLSLPDVATVSLSKNQEKIEITDSEAVLQELGQDFSKVTVSLDITKAKKHIQESGIVPAGAVKKTTQTFTIRFI